MSKMHFDARKFSPEYETPGAPKGQEHAGGHHHSRDASSCDPSSIPAPCGQAKDTVLGIRDWAFSGSPHPAEMPSLLLGLAVVGGIAGKAYNISGSAINQYVLYLAPSGGGKNILVQGGPYLFKLIGDQIKDFDKLGPGVVASGPAIYAAVAERNAHSATVFADEWVSDLEEASNPRNAVGRSKDKMLNQLWGAGGKGYSIEAKAMADVKNNLPSLESPTLTIVGTGVPRKFNALLATDLATTGLLNRHITVEDDGEIAPYNEAHKPNFLNVPMWLLGQLTDIAATACTLERNGRVHDIYIEPEALKLFSDYAESLRKRRSSMPDCPQRDLLNRDHEKSRRVAGTIAVGQNWNNPIVTAEIATWAINFISECSRKQLAKFDTGEAGEEGGNQNRQHYEVKRVIREYFEADHSKYAKLQPLWEMHQRGIVTAAYIQRRLITIKAFKEDKVGATNAINNVIKQFLEQDEIREVPKAQLAKEYGLSPRSFCLVRPNAFFGISRRGGI